MDQTWQLPRRLYYLSPDNNPCWLSCTHRMLTVHATYSNSILTRDAISQSEMVKMVSTNVPPTAYDFINITLYGLTVLSNLTIWHDLQLEHSERMTDMALTVNWFCRKEIWQNVEDTDSFRWHLKGQCNFFKKKPQLSIFDQSFKEVSPRENLYHRETSTYISFIKLKKTSTIAIIDVRKKVREDRTS